MIEDVKLKTDAVADLLFSICASVIHSGERRLPDGIGEHIQEVLALASMHGLEPMLYRCISNEDALPPEIVAHLTQRYYGQAARNAVALHQLEEIAKAFAEYGVPVIALKGAAAILWLYDDIACRVITDLDLLVPRSDVDRAVKAMSELGYSQEQRCTPPNSPEFEELDLLMRLERAQHLVPFVRRGSFSVEIHTNFLKRRKKRNLVPNEIWERAVPLNSNSGNLYRLSTTDFLIHTAVHYPQHLETGIPPLKFMVDMALAVHKEGDRINWKEFWDTAGRWDISNVVSVMMATIKNIWNLDIPGLPESAPALDTGTLIGGSVPLYMRDLMAPEGEYTQRSSAVETLRRYWKRITLAGVLPDRSSRLRYLFHLIFPVPENMRHRYKIPEGRSVAPYYLIHPFVLVKNFFAGLASAVRTSRTRKPH
ncbi:MAG: nucleotidyltransferase domain-containing protein [Armatimonadota bacterium]